MPTVTRDDGSQFATRAYRELLTSKKPSLLKREIRFLERSHGAYARFFTQPDGTIEAVFSRDPGYLLGETVWNYFEKPADLIYCEAMPDGKHALLVIVRATSIYLDAKIPLENLSDELASVTVAGKNFYDIYLYGDLPIRESETEDFYYFPQDVVKSLQWLDESVFNNLRLTDEFRLLPVEQAVKIDKLIKTSPWVYVILIVFAIFLIILLYNWLTEKPTTKVVQPTITTRPTIIKTEVREVNPYQEFENALTTPNPAYQMIELANLLKQFYKIPGWQVKSLIYNAEGLEVYMQSIGGDLQVLQHFATAKSYTLEFEQGEIKIIAPTKLADRTPPSKIYNAKNQLVLFDSRIQKIIAPDVSQGQAQAEAGAGQEILKVTDVKQSENFTEIKVEVNFQSALPQTFQLVAKSLAGVPATLNQVQADYDDGILTGTIDLTIAGD